MKRINQKTRKEIFKRFIKIGVKTKVAKEFGIDPRTVANIIEEYKKISMNNIKKTKYKPKPKVIVDDYVYILKKDFIHFIKCFKQY